MTLQCSFHTFSRYLPCRQLYIIRTPRHHSLFPPRYTSNLALMSNKRKSLADISPPPTKRKLGATSTTTTSKPAVANFFKRTSEKKKDSQNQTKVTWTVINNSCLTARYSPEEKKTEGNANQQTGRKVAAFDLDSTLIATSSGNRFSMGPTDWAWWHESVPKRLRTLHDDGFLIVVISNQKAVSLKAPKKGTDSKSLSNFKTKVTNVLESLNIPITVYAATEYDEYRKPRLGMWREMLDDFGLDVEGRIDFKNSIFVGDASGRPGDHSACDRHFASNIGILFQTPEEFFLFQPPQPVEHFDPLKYIQDAEGGQAVPFSKLHDLELVIFCGSPAAGKSTFYWKYLQPLGYERVNQDILKTRAKCLKVAGEYLREGKSVAVDNTNADPETRVQWVELAKTVKVPIRCIYLATPPDICKHNNAVRAANPKLASINPEFRVSLPGIAFGDFSRRFVEPSASEGFHDITRVDFQFNGAGDAVVCKAWGQHFL